MDSATNRSEGAALTGPDGMPVPDDASIPDGMPVWVDASIPDAWVPPDDASIPDGGVPPDDAGPGTGCDSGIPQWDAGPGYPDGGPVNPDAGPGYPDGGPVHPDAGPGQPDGGPVNPDAGAGATPEPPFPWEAACPASPSGPWVSRSLPDGPIENLIAHFNQIRADVVGHWRGTVVTPWRAPYTVALALESDGHYSARCTEPYCTAFHFGTDRSTPMKQYRLLDMSLLGHVEGEIDIPFEDGSGGLSLPSWQGELEELELDAPGNRLRFEFWTNSGYGAVKFELYRCP